MKFLKTQSVAQSIIKHKEEVLKTVCYNKIRVCPRDRMKLRKSLYSRNHFVSLIALQIENCPLNK